MQLSLEFAGHVHCTQLQLTAFKAITRDITSNAKYVLSINSTFSGNNDFRSKLDGFNIPLRQINRIKVSLAIFVRFGY